MGYFSQFRTCTDKACVQSKIVKKPDGKVYLRIWNSGGQAAYNVNFYIPKSRRIFVLRSHSDYKMLPPGKAFDEFAIAVDCSDLDVWITTFWEDEAGNFYSKEQQANLSSLKLG